jgi:hypothetical protein
MQEQFEYAFSPEKLSAVSSSLCDHATAHSEFPLGESTPRKVSLMIDIQGRLHSGKGPAYECWFKVYNLNYMAAALQCLKENGIADYDELAAGTDAAVERSHKLAAEHDHLRPQAFHGLFQSGNGVLDGLRQLLNLCFQLPQQGVVCLELVRSESPFLPITEAKILFFGLVLSLALLVQWAHRQHEAAIMDALRHFGMIQ